MKKITLLAAFFCFGAVATYAQATNTSTDPTFQKVSNSLNPVQDKDASTIVREGPATDSKTTKDADKTGTDNAAVAQKLTVVNSKLNVPLAKPATTNTNTKVAPDNQVEKKDANPK